MKPIRVGLVGSQFVSTIHAEALEGVLWARSFSPSLRRQAAMPSNSPSATALGITSATTSRMLGGKRAWTWWCWAVRTTCTANSPNWRPQRESTSSARSPLCLNLDEADRMISACHRAESEAHVRRGTLLHAEIRPIETAPRRREQLGRPYLAVKPVREARRTALGLVLGCEALRRRGDHGHGLPRLRVLPLAARETGEGEHPRVRRRRGA